MCNTVIGTFSRIDSQAYFGLITSIGTIPPSLQEHCADRWVMTDLLAIKRTAIDQAMVGLSNDRIERLGHLDGGIGATQIKSHNILKPDFRVRLLSSFFQQFRPITE